MAKNISNENFITIQGWMINELDLKGNELIAFALIYGFSQDGNSYFQGSISYVCEWLNCSRPTAIKILDNLVKQNYVIKEVIEVNNVKFNKYKINLPVVKKFNRGSKETLLGVVKNFNEGSKETLPNNINNNIDIKDKDNIDIIVDYLNLKADKSFKRSTPDTKKHISARLKEGFTVDDFKTVIDKKVKEWKGTDFEKFLRPQTLFGTKFESYLNQTSQIQNKSTNSFMELAKEMGVDL